MIHKIVLATLTLTLLVGFFSVFINQEKTYAAANNFNAELIIDNGTFNNKNTMNAGQIQDALNARLPSCDTWGTKTSEYGGGTRAQYGASRGNPAPFICLKDYSEGGRSSAQIIYDAAQTYNINPQTLIVLLQKEQGLVTDDWPWAYQYRSATGYGCPDTAPCDSQYYGFTNQVNKAARFYRMYIDNPNDSNYPVGVRNVYWNPDIGRCGGGNVNIRNSATSALYTYTPYQPNQSALNAGYGLGDSCGSYGNRNMFLYMRDWFGYNQFQLPGCPEATNTTVTCIWRFYQSSIDQQMLLSSNNASSDLVNRDGYQFENTAMFGNAVPKAGNIPIYRLYNTSSQKNFLTTSTVERDNLIAAGYTNMGIEFYADPAGSNSGFPVYRLHKPSTNKHWWTNNIDERNTLLASGYIDEGNVFSSLSPINQETAPAVGKTLVYRFGLPRGEHFWTTDLYERNILIKSGYSYEGIAWKGTLTDTSRPIYRLAGAYEHMYTTSAVERDALKQAGWRDEGVSWYSNSAGTGVPTYRIYSQSLKVHHWTTDVNEYNVLRSRGWIDEGVVWY